jgi:hypothetical protein
MESISKKLKSLFFFIEPISRNTVQALVTTLDHEKDLFKFQKISACKVAPRTTRPQEYSYSSGVMVLSIPYTGRSVWIELCLKAGGAGWRRVPKDKVLTQQYPVRVR